MKTLSQYPFLIGEILGRHERRLSKRKARARKLWKIEAWLARHPFEMLMIGMVIFVVVFIGSAWFWSLLLS